MTTNVNAECLLSLKEKAGHAIHLIDPMIESLTKKEIDKIFHKLNMKLIKGMELKEQLATALKVSLSIIYLWSTKQEYIFTDDKKGIRDFNLG